MSKKWNVVLFVFTILMMIYFFGVIVFWNRFSLQTYVNGRSVAFQSSEELTLDLFYETQKMQFALQKSDGTVDAVRFKDLGIYRESDNAFVGVKSSSWLWFLDIFHREDYVLPDVFFYDRELLYQKIQNLSVVNGGQFVDANDFRVVCEDGVFDVVYTQDDLYIDTDRLLEVMCEHIQDCDFVINLQEEDCYKSYDLTLFDDSEIELENLDVRSVYESEIVIQMNDSITEVIPKNVLQSGVISCGDGNAKLYPQVFASYAAVLADTYNTVGLDRTFVKHTGEQVTLSAQEKDTFRGYELNQRALLLSILNAIGLGKDASIFAPWYSMGCDLGNLSSDIGGTYIEIDIEQQHLWYYENGGLIVDTDVVTGLDTEDCRTPVGVFRVMELNTNYMMYYSDGNAMSNYFIKLTGDGVGIHDSVNRIKYGGDIWRTDGSHGCINLPYGVEELLFESLKELRDYHIPVIIY